MLGDAATKKEPLVFDMKVFCPDCDSPAIVKAARKGGSARIDCTECGIVEQGVIPYGGGLVVKDMGED